MTRVSHSEVESYLLCRRKHYYGYVMSLQTRSVSTALAMGTAGHAILEASYGYLLTQGESNAEQLAAFDDGLIVAERVYQEIVADGYEDDDKRADLHDMLFNWYFKNEPLVTEGWEIMAVEEEFVLEYDNSDPDNPLQYPFKIDVIARDPNGKVVVVDHKFTYDFLTYEGTELQPQIPKYIGALRALNHKVDYGAYNQIKTRRIVGTKSKAFPDGKGPTLDQALNFMAIKPSPTRVKRVFLEQIGVANEIQYRKATLSDEDQDITSYRVANKMVCQTCNFKDLCVSQLIGGNSKLLIEVDYKIRERKQFAVEASKDAE